MLLFMVKQHLAVMCCVYLITLCDILFVVRRALIRERLKDKIIRQPLPISS